MPLLGSMNDYSPWHCSVMEPGSAVWAQRQKSIQVWRPVHHRAVNTPTCSYHFGSTELACFSEITQPPRVSTWERGNKQTPFSLWLFPFRRSVDALKLSFNLKTCLQSTDMVDISVLGSFTVFCIVQVSCWWFGVGGSLACGECRVIHLI